MALSFLELPEKMKEISLFNNGNIKNNTNESIKFVSGDAKGQIILWDL